MLRRVICSGICILVILCPGYVFLGRLAGLRVGPVRDADFALGLGQRLVRLVSGLARVARRLHVGDGLEQGGEGAVLLAAVLGVPVETVGTRDDAGAVVFGSASWNGAAHGKSSVVLVWSARHRYEFPLPAARAQLHFNLNWKEIA